jgi:hypothetical protein
MPDNSDQEKNLQSAVDSLSEQTRRLEIAKYYTHGNFENAKKMVSGSYKDLYAIKAKFSSSSVYGAFLVFFNTVYQQLTDYFGIVSHEFTVDDIKTTSDWKIFEQEISENLKLKLHDDVLGNHLKEEINNTFTIQFGQDLKKLLDNNDEIGVNHLFQKVTQDKLGFSNVKISVDFNQLSSLDMEIHSISSKKVQPDEMKEGEKSGEDEVDDIERIDAEEDPLDGKTVKLVLEGSLILAPIKGKEISSLVRGDRIKVKVIDKNPKGIALAKAFNAYEEGKMLPITGRIVYIKSVPAGGYKIFAIVAKGIFIKIEEEEDQIKVAIDDLTKKPGESAESEGLQISTPVIIILIVAFLGLITAIFFFLI